MKMPREGILNQFFFSSRFLSADPIAADRGEAHRAIGNMFSRAHLEGGRARHSDDENNQKSLRAEGRRKASENLCRMKSIYESNLHSLAFYASLNLNF